MDWRYPLLFGVDLKSTYRSVWLGWWLITWAEDRYARPWRVSELNISFQPGT